MRVLLVRPGPPNKLSFTNILDSEPLELEYLHTGLMNAGYEDMILDYICQNKPFIKVIKEYTPDIVAISGYITQQNIMKKLCKQAKKYNKNIITVIGGVHAQLNTEVFFEENIDFIMRSESIDAFVDLVRYVDYNSKNYDKSYFEKNNSNYSKNIDNACSFQNNKVNDFSKNSHSSKENNTLNSKIILEEINGLCYKKNNIWIKNKLEPIDINSLPIPDRTFFNENKSKFRYLELTETASIKISFSCPYNCNFCYCTRLNGGHYQVRDLSLVIEEIKSINSENIVIVDDDFLVDEKRLWTFISLIKENNIKKRYVCYARADFISNHPDIVKALADIGFHYFLVGLEAISDDELTDYNKGTKIEHNSSAVSIINSTSAQCIGLMIMGISATKNDFDKLYNWVVDNNLLHVTISIFTPIPGTALYEEYKDKLITDKIENWDFLHLVVNPENISRKEFYLYYYKLILKLYKRAKKAGLYSFINLNHYFSMLSRFLLRKAYLDL